MNDVNHYVFPLPPWPAVAVAGTAATFPVHRIYCVGRNYAAHAREMGSDPTREPPFFFMKPADAIVASGAAIAHPSRTQDFQHEIELVVAIGRAGSDISREDAPAYIYGYAVGNDYTRRDLQSAARREGRPWDVSKGFDASAAISRIHPVTSRGAAPHLTRGRIWLAVNGDLRQEGDVSELIWSVPEIIAELSTYFTLAPGDLIYTGTPAGVSAVKPGDLVAGGIEGLDTIENRIVPRDRTSCHDSYSSEGSDSCHDPRGA